MCTNASQLLPVFIVHWNRPQECARSVQSLLAQDSTIKIAIIDNASSVENYNALREQLPGSVELIRLADNRGWGGGLNVLLQRWLQNEGSPYCIISSHDTIVHEGCISKLVRAVQDDVQIGIACPEYGTPELPKYSPIRGPWLMPITQRLPGTVEYVDFAFQTLCLLRRECFLEIGLYDERYFAYGDEYEISLRVRKHGWQAAIVWGATVTNPGSWTPKPLLSYLLARNTLLLAYTYGGWKHALLRIVFMLLNNLKLYLLPRAKRAGFHPNARLQGVRDFLLGRFGRPPIKQMGS